MVPCIILQDQILGEFSLWPLVLGRVIKRSITRPKKTRPKAKWVIGRVFLSYDRVLKTRPQNHFFVVISAETTSVSIITYL